MDHNDSGITPEETDQIRGQQIADLDGDIAPTGDDVTTASDSSPADDLGDALTAEPSDDPAAATDADLLDGVGVALDGDAATDFASEPIVGEDADSAGADGDDLVRGEQIADAPGEFGRSAS